jgi:hypothetical protein
MRWPESAASTIHVNTTAITMGNILRREFIEIALGCDSTRALRY